MSPKTIVVALLALLCGGGAAGAVLFVNATRQPGEAAETGPVVIAMIDLGRGVAITPEMVRLKEWPKDMIPANAHSKLEDVVGKSTRTAITRDEPVLHSKVGEGKGLQALITPGMRAYTILTPSASAGVGGFIRPDDRVDVILTVSSNERRDERQNTGGAVATVLLQNVQILAAGPSLDTAPDGLKVEGTQLNSVTLLVSSRQAQELTLAQTKGTLNLTLRRDGEETNDSPPPLYLSDLPFVREDPNAVEEAAPEPPPQDPILASPPPPKSITNTVRTYRGTVPGRVIILTTVASP